MLQIFLDLEFSVSPETMGLKSSTRWFSIIYQGQLW